jgi:CT1975-like protein.
LIESAATVSPRGKQASFASRARASFVLTERGSQQPRTLAAAFLKPVKPNENGGDLLSSSIKRLDGFRTDLDNAYGACSDACERMSVSERAGSLPRVIEFAMESVT